MNAVLLAMGTSAATIKLGRLFTLCETDEDYNCLRTSCSNCAIIKCCLKGHGMTGLYYVIMATVGPPVRIPGNRWRQPNYHCMKSTSHTVAGKPATRIDLHTGTSH